MAQVTKPNTFSDNTSAEASEVNDNFDEIYDEFNGSIDSANLATDAVAAANIAANAVTTAKINDSAVTTAKINNAAITPAKRTGGFATGSFTTSGTANVVVTGLAFQPKFIKLTWLPADSTSITRSGSGSHDGTNRSATAARTTTGEFGSVSITDGCLLAIGASSAVVTRGTLSSFNSDGFTLTVSTGSSNNTFAYEAYG